jgi:transcriptional regulator with XRE-family HTH domain
VLHNGAAIREFRQIRGYSVTELARLVSVCPAALYNLQSENKRLSAVLANRIAHELDVPLAAIVCRHDP